MLTSVLTICFVACYAIAFGLELFTLRRRPIWFPTPLIIAATVGLADSSDLSRPQFNRRECSANFDRRLAPVGRLGAGNRLFGDVVLSASHTDRRGAPADCSRLVFWLRNSRAQRP